MILNIMQLGEAVLRKKCEPVQSVDEKVEKFAADMIETMKDAEGVGLAAPQVGVDIRMAVVDTSHDPECVSFFKVNGEDAKMEDHMPLVFINPELEFSGPHETDIEGCLSIQEIRAKVKRKVNVKATLPQLDGSVLVVETDGLCSRAIQHEVDHLNGILFTDRVSSTAKARLKRKLKDLAATKWEYNANDPE
ncbi:peptide deformylase [Rubritalea marina]|uniref:peptide deformylase n=1 Tax=Rubritalea marina TaxID=361055 RepID=UPI0005268764|nr:peptide deformylase [Rubritalea marina]